MLGKLFKHEWKDVCKVGGALTLAVVIVTVLGCLMLQLPATVGIFDGTLDLEEPQVLAWFLVGLMSFILYIFLLMGVTYGMFIFLGLRFYKTMYTEQGYLTNTLPVTAHQLLISKTLVAGIWYLILEIAVIASMFVLLFVFLSSLLSGELAQEGYTMWNFWSMMFEEMGPAFAELGFDMRSYLIIMLVLGLIAPFTSMMILFGSLTMGQLSKKHKALMGLLAYFGVIFINMILTSIVQVIQTIGYTAELVADPYGDPVMNMDSTYIFTLIITTALAVGLYFLSHFILTKKLNMD